MSFGLQDVKTLEEDDTASHEEICISLQRAINSCMWGLQGSYGRSMMAAIEGGECMLGRQDCRDYWGNHIPSRDQVEAGTKGSREYVVEAMGEEWAKMVEAVE